MSVHALAGGVHHPGIQGLRLNKRLTPFRFTPVGDLCKSVETGSWSSLRPVYAGSTAGNRFIRSALVQVSEGVRNTRRSALAARQMHRAGTAPPRSCRSPSSPKRGLARCSRALPAGAVRCAGRLSIARTGRRRRFGVRPGGHQAAPALRQIKERARSPPCLQPVAPTPARCSPNRRESPPCPVQGKAA